MAKLLISCKELSMSYENRAALENVSFEVFEGDYLCVVGENGSGKSTLLKGILGLMPVKSGRIAVDAGLRLGGIGYLPQQTQAQKDFPASVREVVLSGCLAQKGLRPFFTKKEKLFAQSNMDALHIRGIARTSFRHLSGGQQQRVLLARALCAGGSLLLLDEPGAGLDPLVSAELYDIINRLHTDRSVTIVMVTHDVSKALLYANKILHLDAGVEFFGAAADYTASAAGKRFTGGCSHG